MLRKGGLILTAALAGLACVCAGAKDLPKGEGLADRFVTAARAAYVRPEYAAYTNSLLTTAAFRTWQGRADLPSGGLVAWVDVGGTANFRDIGGWNGLKKNLVFRGAEPNCHPPDVAKGKRYGYHNLTLTPEGERTLSKTLAIRTDLDLRGRGESPTPDVSPVSSARLVRIPCGSYTNFLADTKTAAKILRVFADRANYPIYFHCYGGADRTGSVAFLLEGLCGVNETDLCIDYELTSFSRIGRRPRYDRPYYYAAMLREIKRRPGATLREKFEDYARHACGLSKEEIAAVRRMLCPAGGGDAPSPAHRSAVPMTLYDHANAAEWTASAGGSLRHVRPSDWRFADLPHISSFLLTENGWLVRIIRRGN